MEQGFGDGQPDFGVCALSPNNMPQDQTAIPCPSCVEATPQAEQSPSLSQSPLLPVASPVSVLLLQLTCRAPVGH